jgi:NADH:ubiquinone oxidoreductase subunit D
MAQLIDDDPRIIEFDVRTDEMLVNMGPQHPSTHGVLRLVLRTDGEIVSQVEPHIGYLHRCAEKIGENLSARQWIPYTDRMDYLAAMNMNLGWALAVEKLMKYEVSEKARHLRVLIAELCRIASHLVGMGAYGLEAKVFSSKALMLAGAIAGSFISGFAAAQQTQTTTAIGFQQTQPSMRNGILQGVAQTTADQSKRMIDEATAEKPVLVVEAGESVVAFFDEEVRY